tara:strand:- start:5608 stop:5832 length:225 start_codon:yes stop_codon:yes gene_type:complete
MKSFQKLRNATSKKEKIVSKKRINNIPVQVSNFIDKGIKKYGLYIDGDKLDNYKSEREAMLSANEFIKQYRKSK